MKVKTRIVFLLSVATAVLASPSDTPLKLELLSCCWRWWLPPASCGADVGR